MMLQIFNQVAHRGFCHVRRDGKLTGTHPFLSQAPCRRLASLPVDFPSDQLVINVGVRGPTNHMERWHNTLAQRLGRYTRKTLAFSKSDTYRALATHTFIVRYDLAILHASRTLQP